MLDSSESWKITSDTLSTVYRFYLTHDSLPQPSKPSGKIICESLPIGNNAECESIYLGGSWGITISISKAKLNSYTSNELKRYLALNPITVRYQLAEKVVKTVDLSVVNQDGDTLIKIKPIEGTMHVKVSGSTINPTAVLEVPVEAITQNLNSFIKEE